MYIDNLTDEEWRFDVVANGSETTIYRGRKYQLPSDWTYDSWRNYWDGDFMVAVYDHPDYSSPTSGGDTDRVEHAMRMCREYDQDIDETLARLARRIEGNFYAGFVAVGVERGVTLYALMWNSVDEVAAREWAEEIKAVYHGEIYRVECEEYNTFTQSWEPADDLCEEWYGEDNADRGFVAAFPMEDFPAELFVSEGA